MSNFIVYSCHCLNIRIHLATKYTANAFAELKEQAAVKEPFPGLEFELGMGGIIIEFNTLVHTERKSGWKTTSCLNCNCGKIYSVTESSSLSKAVVHENAIYGEEAEKVKQDPQYSSIFKIKLNQDTEDLVPMPSAEDVPGKLVSTHQQIISLVDLSIEKIRLESKLRIEEFKQKEEKQTQALISKAKLENNQLWSKIIQITDQNVDEKKGHVTFAPAAAESSSTKPTIRKIGFALSESDISTSLKNKNLDHYNLNMLSKNDQEEEEEEEDMFNLDEEFSEEEKEDESLNEDKEEEEEEKEEEEKEEEEKQKIVNKKDLLLSSSLQKSISEIDQKFSWIKKKRNTSKYMRKDFDLKTDVKKGTDSNNSEEDKHVSLFATSVPITIHYPIPEDEEEGEEAAEKKDSKKKDLVASSFVNFDFSYSDRMLSEQFPESIVKRKIVPSNSNVCLETDSIIGKSLDTRALMEKKEKVKK
ncbi:hypothetical protein EDC94DRAFT_77597 [Helicostylum pulchrum]|nr:hypothetical protein EDC94DRAFT_77597 [Helicostylum pulchrum]